MDTITSQNAHQQTIEGFPQPLCDGIPSKATAKSRSVILRQLRILHPEVLNTAINSINEYTSDDVIDFCGKFYEVNNKSFAEVSNDKGGSRTLLVACVVKRFDPYAIAEGVRMRGNIIQTLAAVLSCSNESVRQISMNVKGLLRAHKPFIREVELILEKIEQYGKEEAE